MWMGQLGGQGERIHGWGRKDGVGCRNGYQEDDGSGHGQVVAIAQLSPTRTKPNLMPNYTLAFYPVAIVALIGMFPALPCNRTLHQTPLPWFFDKEVTKGITIDTASPTRATRKTPTRNPCTTAASGPPTYCGSATRDP